MARARPTSTSVGRRQPPGRSSPARFIPPMLLLRADTLPEGDRWLYELKLDGYRAIAFKRNGKVSLRSRNDNDFSGRYPAVVEALAALPDNTVVDGEVVAFDQDGRPSFNALQNYGSGSGPVACYLFDVMVLAGRDLCASRCRSAGRFSRRESSRSSRNQSGTRLRSTRISPP